MAENVIEPPWAAEQVTRLNAFQRAGVMHPFTCGNDACPGVSGMHASLVAGEDGWHCPACDYTQKWAHGFMADGSCETHPLFPVAEPVTRGPGCDNPRWEAGGG